MAQMIVNNALQEWSQEIAKAQANLHPDEHDACYIMSVTRRKQGIVGGVISKVTPDVAALHVAGETHREATPEEIDAWNREQDARRHKQLAEQAKREQKFSFDIGPVAEMLVRLGLNAGQVQAAPAATQSVPVPVAPPMAVPQNTERTQGKKAGAISDGGNAERF